MSRSARPIVRSVTFDPAEMALRGRIGAFTTHSRHDPRETTRAAREAFARRFEDEVDPRRELDESERLRRAQAARRAHFSRLALRRRKRGDIAQADASGGAR